MRKLSLILILALLVRVKPVLAAGTELLSSAWTFSGNNGASENYASVPNNSLANDTSVQLTYDLKGLCLLGGDASAVVFDQNGSWHYVSLSNYGKNCLSGSQTVTIPLSSFPGLNTSQPVGMFHMRIWYGSSFSMTVTSVQLIANSTVTTSPPPATNPPPTTSTQHWAIQSVSSMKETKDKICGQDDAAFINQWLDRAKALGVNYVAIETPYDSPSCGNSVAYTNAWVSAARAHGLAIWHRHMPLAFEGIYSVPKTKQDWISQITNYIKANPKLFANGDIFSPIPEPQNGGISGITYCANSFCQFTGAADFNSWLRNAMTASKNAFAGIGLNNMKIGYWGFDGFVAWGDNNPDWHGILEDATVQQMGNITIDHYPEAVGDTMANDLNELQNRYPNVPIVIGEWGTITTTINPVTQVNNDMSAAERPNVVGFNYWHLGMGGNEALINSDFSIKPSYTAVQNFFTGKK